MQLVAVKGGVAPCGARDPGKAPTMNEEDHLEKKSRVQILKNHILNTKL